MKVPRFDLEVRETANGTPKRWQCRIGNGFWYGKSSTGALLRALLAPEFHPPKRPAQ